jgi:hypothetical protein
VNIQAGEVRNERISREEMGKWEEEIRQRDGMAVVHWELE